MRLPRTCSMPGALKSARLRGFRPSRLPGAARDMAQLSAGTGARAGASNGSADAVGESRWEEVACASGSTWLRMPRVELARHVLAIGERLGLGEGMSILDAGSTCGHALSILQERYHNRLRAFGIDGSKTSIKHARHTCRGTFCVGDVRQLVGVQDNTFDVAFSMGTLSQLTSERDVCSAARELGRVIRPGGRAMIVSVPKASCATTQDSEWDCPRCFWKLRKPRTLVRPLRLARADARPS